MRALSIVVLLIGVAVFGFAVWAGRSAPPRTLPVARTDAPAPATTEIAQISSGQDVDLAAHAAPTGYTLFEYTADW